MTMVFSDTVFISIDISFDSGDNANLVLASRFFPHLIRHNLEKVKLTSYS